MMTRDFYNVTAELVMTVVDAIQAYSVATEVQISDFCDISQDQAKEALGLAVDMGLLKCDLNNGLYKSASPLTVFASSGNDVYKSTMLRIILESYEPFIRFRDRLQATNSVDNAATQIKQLLDLNSHREIIKDTLISLGTYTNALKSAGGGRYELSIDTEGFDIYPLSEACSDIASAEAFIRDQIGIYNDRADREKIIIPLASSILKALSNENRECISEAGNAVESFLSDLATRLTVDLSGTNGVNQKLDKFGPNNKLPKKIRESAKYLGHIRNAASHGVDQDINAQWSISDLTAKNYPLVACGFIHVVLEFENNSNYTI